MEIIDRNMDALVRLEPEESVTVIVNNLYIHIKRNDEGVSVDYYPLHAPDDVEPFKEDQVWYEELK
jgi:hypothetical protein